MLKGRFELSFIETQIIFTVPGESSAKFIHLDDKTSWAKQSKSRFPPLSLTHFYIQNALTIYNYFEVFPYMQKCVMPLWS